LGASKGTAPSRFGATVQSFVAVIVTHITCSAIKAAAYGFRRLELQVERLVLAGITTAQRWPVPPAPRTSKLYRARPSRTFISNLSGALLEASVQPAAVDLEQVAYKDTLTSPLFSTFREPLFPWSTKVIIRKVLGIKTGRVQVPMPRVNTKVSVG